MAQKEHIQLKVSLNSGYPYKQCSATILDKQIQSTELIVRSHRPAGRQTGRCADWRKLTKSWASSRIWNIIQILISFTKQSVEDGDVLGIK